MKPSNMERERYTEVIYGDMMRQINGLHEKTQYENDDAVSNCFIRQIMHNMIKLDLFETFEGYDNVLL